MEKKLILYGFGNWITYQSATKQEMFNAIPIRIQEPRCSTSVSSLQLSVSLFGCEGQDGCIRIFS